MFLKKWADGSRFECVRENALRKCQVDDVGDESKRESRHDLIRKVGMISRAQEALEDLRIAALTSSMFVGEKDERRGGTMGGSMCGETL